MISGNTRLVFRRLAQQPHNVPEEVGHRDQEQLAHEVEEGLQEQFLPEKPHQQCE